MGVATRFVDVDRRHRGRTVGSTASPVEMGAFSHDGHAFIVDHRHLSSVGHSQHLSGYHFRGRPLGQNPPCQADNPGQVDRHGVYFVGGDNDSHAVVVQVME